MKLKLVAKIWTRIIITSIVLLISLFPLFSQPDTWVQKANFPGIGGHGGVGFSIGSKGYIGTGRSGYSKDFWEYDPSTNTWSQKADFGGIGRLEATGFSIGAKGYLGTGVTGGAVSKDFWEYDPSNNTWTQKSDFGGTARGGAVGFSIGNKGYIGTGYHFNGSTPTDFWEFDPSTNSWTQKADFGGGGKYRAVGFSIGAKGYIGTGSVGSGKAFWEYDPATNIWLQKADFGGSERYEATGFSIGNKGYIGAGHDDGVSGTGGGTGNARDFWEYNPETNSWLQRANVGGPPRQGALGFSIGASGYLGIGSDGATGNNDFWEYTPIDEVICEIGVSAGADEYMYFGYAPDQCKTKTAIVTGGTTPFTFNWTLDRALLTDETLSGNSTSTITLCLLDTAELCVTVTDASGCTSTDCSTIFAEDVRCFAGNSSIQKVTVCHKGKRICVGESAVDAHLAHGDYVGKCTAGNNRVGATEEVIAVEKSVVDESDFGIYPNPSTGDFIVSLDLAHDTKGGTIQIMNMSGQVKNKINVYDQDKLTISIEESGVYFVQLIENKKVVTKKLVVIH